MFLHNFVLETKNLSLTQNSNVFYTHTHTHIHMYPDFENLFLAMHDDGPHY